MVVTDVLRGGPANEAGIQSLASTTWGNEPTSATSQGIITTIDGYSLKSMENLISYLARETTPGQNVQRTVLRNGNDWITLDVQLDARP